MRGHALIFILCFLFTGIIPVLAQDNDADTIFIENDITNINALLIELEFAGLIPSGANEAFTQPALAYSGEGAQFSNFAIDNPAEHLLMGLTLTFDSQSDELEFCGMAGRAEREETNREDGDNTVTTIRLNSYVATGIDNTGHVFAFERGADTNSELALSGTEFNLSEPIFLLAIIMNDSLRVFANGEEVISDYAITLDAGVFAFLYSGANEESNCRAENFFAYTFSDESVDSCNLISNRVVNRRGGAGTEFGVIAQMQAGLSLEAVAQTVGSDGYIWWQLADESFVRDDVISARGFCRALPDVDVDS